VPNAFKLIGGMANAIAPGKRPLSSMTPLIVVKDGRPVMCAGGSGGPLIVSETVQAVINVLDFGMNAEAAVSAPRIHAQWVPDAFLVEPEVPADVREGLRRRGQKVVEEPEDIRGAAQVIVVKPDFLEAASDPRKGGAPAAP
jgi:gamma-glutamyltranspeptidase/glutathione hydrolase